MIKVDQDTLCDYCKDYHDSKMDLCEGSQCEKITDIYLDDNGVTEDDPTVRTFRKVCVGDEFYTLIHDQITPEIKKRKVNSISQMNDEPLRIHYESNCFHVPLDRRDEDNTQCHFLYQKDCEERLKDVCMKRILRLSQVIGSIK